MLNTAPATALLVVFLTSVAARPAAANATGIEDSRYVASADAAADSDSAPAGEGESEMRLRIGAMYGMGTFVPGPMVSFGGDVHAGIQLNSLFGAYVTLGHHAGIWLGGSVSTTGASVQASAAGYWFIGAMGEITLGDTLFLAGGPMLASGGWASVSQGAGTGGVSQQVVAAGGDVVPGVDLRVGLGFGNPNQSGRRHQFSITVGGQFLFTTVTSVSQQVTTSGGVSQGFSTGDPIIGFAPMIFLGYDAR